jgi:hypothetical protein
MANTQARGWAVHATEYNIASNDLTQDNSDAVICRQPDMEHIEGLLRNDGHFVEEMERSLCGLAEDFVVNAKLHQQQVHLKWQVDNYVFASIGLIIRKKFDGHGQ